MNEIEQVNDGLISIEKGYDTKVWVIAPGENASLWDECLELGIMSIGWDEMGDLSLYKSKAEVTTALQQTYNNPNSSFTNVSLALWEFAFVIQPGDIIYAKNGVHEIVGMGVVKGEYVYDDSRPLHRNVRKVAWKKVGHWDSPFQLANKTLTKITKYSDSKQLEGLVNGVESVECENVSGYWWLVSSPSIWSAKSLKVGETVKYTLYNQSGKKRKVFQNFLDAKKGDKVVLYESTPTLQIVALAEVERESDAETIVFKKIESIDNAVDYSVVKNTVELKDMQFLKSPQGSFYALTEEEFNVILELIRVNNPTQSEDSINTYCKEDFLNEVFMTYDDYDRLKALLLTKQNLILQGAPGVGKTFTAKRLAYSIIGQTDKSKVEMVQFHQSYSYEDFVLGYKPSENGFELRRGVFYKFCKKASQDPDNKYFFVIDEINRGNISKILGELMMLIEKDYRGEKHAIKLSYEQDSFFYVPSNLYIIGMMNTADRSLAMIDYALRRRFSFFEMKPGFDTEGFKQYQKKLNNIMFDELIDAVKALNTVISKDDSLGDGFCIGHSYFCNQEEISQTWLQNVVDFDIVPMLKEYWFDNDEKSKTEVEKLLAIVK